jgi:hypothetical protein
MQMDVDKPLTKTKTKQRVKANRELLQQRLETWRFDAHANDPLAAVRPIYYILPNTHICILISQLPHTIRSSHDVTSILGQTWSWEQLWGEGIYKVIAEFDRDVEKTSSPEFINESDCDEDTWAEVLRKDQETRERTEKAALDLVGLEVTNTKGRKRKGKRYAMDNVTNTK